MQQEPLKATQKQVLSSFSFSLDQLCRLLEALPGVYALSHSDNTLPTIQKDATAILKHLKDQKEEVLKTFDPWLLPLAQEVLNVFVEQAEQLKRELDQFISAYLQSIEIDWVAHAKAWKEVCHKWSSRQELIQQILLILSSRSKQLIDKDIQIIEDYKIQTLSRASLESTEYKNLQDRLSDATEEPLKRLIDLKQLPDHASLKQFSSWLKEFQAKRSSYFDHLLMKIDGVAKDIVYIEEIYDLAMQAEIESEFKFMDHEIEHIKTLLIHLKPQHEKEKQFIYERLEGLQDHLNNFHPDQMPSNLKEHYHHLLNTIQTIEKQCR